MLDRDDILEALNDFTESAQKRLEGGEDWFDAQGVETQDLVSLYTQLLLTGGDAMRKLVDDMDYDYEDERYQRADALIDLMDRTKDDESFLEVMITLLMLASALGINLMNKKHETEIQWEF